MNDRIQEIKARLDSATNGNWEVTDLGDIHITTEHRVEGDKHVAHWIAEMYVDDCDDEQEVERAHNDAFFIANSKADIAYLLSEVERLTRYLERISVTFGEFECQRLAKEALSHLKG